MSHARQQIREALVATLTGLTTTGTNVFGSRAWPFSVDDLPALRVTTDEESVESLSIHRPEVLSRALTVRVEGIARATADLDDTLDTIAAEVESAIAATESAATAGGLLDSSLILQSIAVEMEAAEQPVGRITLEYRGIYSTLSNAPDTAL